MKKSNLIITLAVALILAVSSVGAVLAATGVFAAGTDAPATGTLGALTFSPESGIRWNEGNNAFEVFDAAGVSYISSNFWIDHTGDYAAADIYADEAEANAAGFSQASPLKTYHIMNDIVYPTIAAAPVDDEEGEGEGEPVEGETILDYFRRQLSL